MCSWNASYVPNCLFMWLPSLPFPFENFENYTLCLVSSLIGPLQDSPLITTVLWGVWKATADFPADTWIGVSPLLPSSGAMSSPLPICSCDSATLRSPPTTLSFCLLLYWALFFFHVLKVVGPQSSALDRQRASSHRNTDYPWGQRVPDLGPGPILLSSSAAFQVLPWCLFLSNLPPKPSLSPPPRKEL